jgi:hypothetical protein
MRFEILLDSGEPIEMDQHITRALEKCSSFTLDELEQQLRDLLSSQCTFYTGRETASVWPWVVALCNAYKQKGHIVKEVTESPSYMHVRHIRLEFLEGHTLESLKKSVVEEARKIRIVKC